MQLIGTGKQRAGKTARITVGVVPLTYASWNVDMYADDLPTVNFESYNAVDDESYDEGIHGPLGAKFTFGGDWDAGRAAFGNPPGLYPRDDLTALLLYTSRLDVVGFNFPYARLRGATVGADVKGKVTFQCSGMNQGRFFYPVASV